MTTSTRSSLSSISPAEVHSILGRHILADGFDIVVDYEKSHGSWLHDARTSRELLDFCSFFASNPIGYNHPKMKDPAFQEVLGRVAQVKPSLADLYSVEYAWFVETFGRIAIPPHLKYAFFIEGGTLGVENALKVAFDWKVRRNREQKGIAGVRGQKILHFREAFHGRSGYALSLTNTDPAKTDFFPKFDWPRVSNPKLRFPVTAEVEREVEAAEDQALDEIDAAFAASPDDVAAIIVEPIQAEGGDNHFRPQFLQAVQAKAHEHAAFFILDEVQTGIGITGKMWAHEHFGLRPDAVAFGKVFRVSSRINSTWGGGLTDMVRSARYLEILEEDSLVENARVVGERLLAGLVAVQNALGGKITNARGRGLMIAFDLPTPELRDRAQDALLANGLLVLGCGRRAIRFRPALNVAPAEADAALDIVRRTVKEL
jgi:L-lysine 6-transaminase